MQNVVRVASLQIHEDTRKEALDSLAAKINKIANIKIFQSTLPVRGATAKMHKFPAASLAEMLNLSGAAPEKPYQTGSKAGALCSGSPKKPREPPGNLCALMLRATKSGYPPADRCSCSRSAQPSFRIDSPNSRSGGCPFPDP